MGVGALARIWRALTWRAAASFQGLVAMGPEDRPLIAHMCLVGFAMGRSFTYQGMSWREYVIVFLCKVREVIGFERHTYYVNYTLWNNLRLPISHEDWAVVCRSRSLFWDDFKRTKFDNPSIFWHELHIHDPTKHN